MGTGKTKQSNRVIQCYEQAIFSSQLSAKDKRDVASSFMEYLREHEHSFHYIKMTESRLREALLFEQQASQVSAPSGTNSLKQEVASKGTLLGKRQRTE
jgi:hypothetical protein